MQATDKELVKLYKANRDYASDAEEYASIVSYIIEDLEREE